MPYIMVEKSCIREIRQRLLELKLLHEDERIQKVSQEVFAIPVVPSVGTSCTEFVVNGRPYIVKQTIDISSTMRKRPYDLMREKVEILMKQRKLWKVELINEMPTSWVKFGDLILFGRNSFEDPVWEMAGDALWQEICGALKVKRLGRMSGIKPDGYRSPKVTIMYGDDSWVNVVDGHVRYTWDVRYCMFSPGNATERFRIAQMDCHNETVVDMYAGIGYFTIPFLAQAKAERVHACEWNPHAVAALRENLINNQVSSRCCIHVGDNREVCPQNVADRVYLGLIPTCKHGIETACKALKIHSGGFLHLHENVCDWKKSSVANCEPLSEFSMISLSSNKESGVESKNYTAESLPCEKCLEIETNILTDLGIISAGGEGHKFNLSTSFTIKGSEGIVCVGPSKVNWRKKEWFYQAAHFSHTVCSILSSFSNNPWMVSVTNIHHVKSYAPHINHLVIDLKCSPVTEAV